MLDKVKIFATSFSEESIELIKSGEYPYKKIEISVENYKRFQGESELNNYYKEEKYRVRRDTTLIKNIEFIKDDNNFSKAPKNIKLILLRNVLIYFNPSFQENIIEKFHGYLSGFGNLIIGLKEKIRVSQNAPHLFEAVEANEGVFKKRLV
jgi:chemotaxis methyl-accepting protein methylase